MPWYREGLRLNLERVEQIDITVMQLLWAAGRLGAQGRNTHIPTAYCAPRLNNITLIV
jgi:hypothetical protein